jgi:hypothetical protein
MPKLTFRAGKAFDAALAALAAASAGFLVFAMPERLFSGLVSATPLPGLIAAAEPPLGTTARLAAVAAIALFVFALVWALMGLLERVPARRTGAVSKAVDEVDAPRLRRADAHPDAPSRRPLVAGRDLGEPIDSLPEPVLSPEEARPLPSFLVAEPEPEPEPQPEPAAEPAPEPQAAAEDELVLEPASEETPLSELAARLPEPGRGSEEPLSQLVGRIETGLGRKRRALPEPAPEAAAPQPQEPVGHRLRSAINDLQKMAARSA